MRREEKKRKFHEAVMNMLFPSSIDDECDDDPDMIPTERHDNVPPLNDNAEDNYSSLPEEDTSEDSNLEFQKKQLTRAQRKRIRKKRLKEESARRGKMIGPLFPLNGDVICSKGDEESCGVAKDDALDIQNNGKMGYGVVPSKGGDRPLCESTKKLKHRRAAKRKAKVGSKPSDSEQRDGSADQINGL